MRKGDAMAIASGLFHSGSSPMKKFDDFGYLTLSAPNTLDVLTAREVRRSGEASPLQTAAYAYSFFVGRTRRNPRRQEKDLLRVGNAAGGHDFAELRHLHVGIRLGRAC
jgi:hypothetical protein